VSHCRSQSPEAPPGRGRAGECLAYRTHTGCPGRGTRAWARSSWIKNRLREEFGAVLTEPELVAPGGVHWRGHGAVGADGPGARLVADAPGPGARLAGPRGGGSQVKRGQTGTCRRDTNLQVTTRKGSFMGATLQSTCMGGTVPPNKNTTQRGRRQRDHICHLPTLNSVGSETHSPLLSEE